MSHLYCRGGVDDDILEAAIYLADQSARTAERFVDSVQATLKTLAAMPGAGSPKRFRDRALTGVRTWRVKGFPHYLIYYVPIERGIDVLAVLHGARQARKILRKRREK